MSIEPSTHEPTEIARIPVDRTGETLHIGYVSKGQTRYITAGQLGGDYRELSITEAEHMASALADAIRDAIRNATLRSSNDPPAS